jgi:hypothetical protein
MPLRPSRQFARSATGSTTHRGPSPAPSTGCVQRFRRPQRQSTERATHCVPLQQLTCVPFRSLPVDRAVSSMLTAI